LASAVLGRTLDERPLVFVVTGAAPGVGATTVACLLAEELAQRGRRTLLVDGNLAAPDVARRYRERDGFVGAEESASTVAWLRDPERARGHASIRLAGGVTLDLVLQPRPTRPAPGAVEAFFEGFPSAIERWAGYQTVVVDSAALLAVEDTRWLARAATGTLLVERSDGRDERRVRAAYGLLRDVGASLLGRVENDAPPVADEVDRPAGATDGDHLRVVRHAGPRRTS
jgi:Mrp family chromosome partitioning ATPase